MPNTILSAWGKIVYFMGFASRKIVDEHPQMAIYATITPRNDVYNPRFVPDFTDLFPQLFPQAIYTQLHLLKGTLSPLSTPPIITTTNLKSKER